MIWNRPHPVERVKRLGQRTTQTAARGERLLYARPPRIQYEARGYAVLYERGRRYGLKPCAATASSVLMYSTRVEKLENQQFSTVRYEGRADRL